MIQEEIRRRNLPPVLPEGMTAEKFGAWREEMLKLYASECYGVTPPAPAEVRAQTLTPKRGDWADKATHEKVQLSFDMEKGEFSFPVDLVIPKAMQPAPCVVYVSFSPYGASDPIEEIVDAGFALAMFRYSDVTSDDGDFTNGMAAMTSRDSKDAWGKFGMWAYAASRVLDYLETVPEIDSKRVIVAGHSRLGKTALWAAAQDERFAGVFSNESGCSGAAVMRGKIGETVEDICRVFPYWFCENYHKYRKNEENAPFEQYHLLGCIAPRALYAASAIGDQWSDPVGEFLGVCLVEDIYALLGKEALGVKETEMLRPGQRLAGEMVGYHLREGSHFLSRYDWIRALKFMQTRI